MATNCVSPQQKKSAEYIAAMEKFNISSGELEMILHEYQNAPENAAKFQEGKLSFPSDSYIQKAMYGEESITSDPKVIEIYEKVFSTPFITSSKVQAIEAAKNASKYFEEKSIKIRQTKDGKYKVLVAPPVFVASNVNWARTSENNYEVSSQGDKRFSALYATFKEGTIIDGEDVGGKTIEWVYQNIIKKSGKGKAPSKDSKLFIPSREGYKGDIIPSEDTIFVFGSNPEGRHGAGAAKVAKDKFGAQYGVGEGLTGNAYALPTKDLRVKENKGLRSIPKESIIESIKTLYKVATENPGKQFKVAFRNKLDEATLSGYTGEEMIDMFLSARPIPSNIIFSEEWLNTGKFNLSKQEIEDFSYEKGYLPLWQEWAKQNPELIEELRKATVGKTLTDKFASTRVSQARALADILNEKTSNTTDLVIVPAKDTSKKAKEIGGIDTLRHPDENGMHFGNPFSHTNYVGVQKVMPTVREAVIAFEKWLRGEEYQDVEPERRQWIINQINSGTLTGKPLIYYTENIPDNSWGVSTYNYYTAPNHAHILQKLINEKPLNLSNKGEKFSTFEFYSGAAIGADTEWEKVAKSIGIKVKNYTVQDWDSLSTTWKNILDNEYREVVNLLGRRVLDAESYSGKLVRRDMMQADKADAIFAIGKIASNGYVDGGTGYATTRGILRGIPVYVFDQTDKQWKVWDTKTNKFIVTSEPVLTPHAAVIGTRQLEESGKEAIKNIILNTISTDNLKSDKKQITEERTDNEVFFEKQSILREQLKAVYGIDSDFTGEEFRQIAADIVYEISDIITEVEKNPEAILKYNSIADVTKVQNASRASILSQIGIANILDYIKSYNFSPSNNPNITGRKDGKKARIIAENINAFLTQGSSLLLQLEGFGITDDFTVNEDVDTQMVEDFNSDNEKESIQETVGSLQEHWQIESRTENVFDKASILVKQALTQCYKMNADGTPVVSKWGVKQRIDGRDALQSIIRWTQGALTLDSMIKKLESHASKETWIIPILERLKDTSGKESTFQSQFFGVVSKYFQLYSVGKKSNGQYSVFEVNTHPALTDAKNGISGLYNAGAHPLFDSNGNVNTTALEQLKSIWESLEKRTLTPDNANDITEMLSSVSTLLGYSVSPEAISEVLDSKTFIQMTKKSLQYIVKSLEDNKSNASWQPFSGSPKDNGIINNIGKFITPLTDKLEDVTNSSFYDSGNMYQSYVTPSYLTKLVQKFRNLSAEEFNAFMEEEYGKFEQFKQGDDWRNSWLELFESNPLAREIFAHKVQLNFAGSKYMINRGGLKAMSEAELTISIIAEYFREEGFKSSKELAPAWFRVPLMSNKPSSEFVRFFSYRGPNYKERVLKGCIQLFTQELSRIQTVKKRNELYSKEDPEWIENFDSKGSKFCFFDFLNDVNNARFHELVDYVTSYTSKENGKIDSKFEDAITELSTLAKTLIKEHLEAEFAKQYEIWTNNGVVEAAKSISAIPENSVPSALENFFWNDFLSANNLLNLTITDLAYYKNTEDVQKRLAQLHAPGIRPNVDARDFEGNKVADSKTRTLYLRDVEIDGEKIKSNIIANVKAVFDKKLKELEGTPQYKITKATYESIIESFESGINIADAQGYASPTSYRKKALLFGKWSEHAEEIYQKLIKGTYTYTDLQVAFQPLKPFVYTQVEHETGINDGGLPSIKMGVQNKNSEYLLILANAITQNEDTGLPNYLKAIYQVMEDSHKGTTGTKGNHIPRVDGIDTVQFESTVKTGKTGLIDITDAGSTEEAIALLEDAVYENKEEHNYNSTYVQELNFEDYCIQQEVPEHFKDHEQQQGSQIRMIIPSDLHPNKKYKVEGQELTAKDFRRRYEEIISDNIEEAIEEVRKEFGLDSGTKLTKNVALAKTLQKEILSSPRYGLDLLMACLLDENGNFAVPLGDSIQSKRIEQLLNSIIKNRVNKQKIAGGPVVQVSNFGTSRQLNIRFRDKNNSILYTLNEYLEQGKTEQEWIDYINENQSGIAYYECFAPVYMQSIFEDFMDANGNIDVEAMEKLSPELLKMIGYRIPSEDKYSLAPLKIVGFMPKEAGDGVMLPYEITLITGSDFDIDKFYLMRKEIPIVTKSRKDIERELINILGKKKIEEIKIFLDQLSNSDQKIIAKSNYPDIWKEYVKIAYQVKPYKEGRRYRNNAIIDMSWEVLTHEDSADKVLNPGGFEEQKREGYLAEAARIKNTTTSHLEHLSTKELKKICESNKNLAFIGTHTQFYKQNAAAGSILAIFAVAKVAHACLESNRFKVDVSEVCGINSPISIMGLNLFGRVEIDAQKDIEGNFIGKTLGSLVASAADAVKDPVLNLMNINSDTVNILNTLIRLGLPFRKAARLLSSDVVTELLKKYNIEKLKNPKISFNKILEDSIQEISSSNNNLLDSSIMTEDLTDEEVENALIKRNPSVDFKILLTLKRISSINYAMSGLNFATRFNSISSAVGPLVIDNLKIENTLENFPAGIYNEAEDEVGIQEVLDRHPVLESFCKTVYLARELFGRHIPIYRNQFMQVIHSLQGTSLLRSLYKDRKLFSTFSDFYQSLLLVESGVIDVSPNTVHYYVREFAAQFAKNNYKTIFAGNPFIEAIRFDVDSESKTPVLKINVTGLDTETKSKLTSGWLDLYKSGEEGKKIAIDLFKYCFYRGGIGFNPKTFMHLFPVQLRMNLEGYKEAFEGNSTMEGFEVISQFIRNNWSDDSIVPYRRFKNPLRPHDGGYVDFLGEEALSLSSVIAFKTNIKGATYLYIRTKYDADRAVAEFREVKPLGNNGEFLEFSFSSLSSLSSNSVVQTPVNPNYADNTNGVEITEAEIVDEPVNSGISENNVRTLAEQVTDSVFSAEEINEFKSLGGAVKLSGNSKVLDLLKSEIIKALEAKGVKVNEKEVNDIAEKYC